MDLFYTNIKNSHTCRTLFPLGRSDHKLTHLFPKYKPLIQRQPPTRKTVMSWTAETWSELRHCFETTDWTIFTDNACNVEELADTVLSYINFCVDTIVPRKTIKIYANNKPWVTKNIKGVLNKKKVAFINNEDQTKLIQKEVKHVIRKGKEEYKKKVEKQFEKNDMKKVWDGISLMSGRSNKKKECNSATHTIEFANDLNKFYARFDNKDFTNERNERLGELRECQRNESESDTMYISENHVLTSLKKMKKNKAPGPDGLSPNVLKYCAHELYKILCFIFNLSLLECNVPTILKTSVIIPVPKKIKC